MDTVAASVVTSSENTSSLFPNNFKPVEFSGKSREFFGIWIVNLLLSILTLGVYSAWAKVRTQQYLYGHTRLEGHRFHYHAKPLQILIGRAIAFTVFALFIAISSLNPAAGAVLALVMIFAGPWIMLQAMRFNLRMSSYRNVRFSFSGTYGGMLTTFILLPVLGMLSLYLAFPWVLKKMDTYMFNHIGYGQQKMTLGNRTSEYYLTALLLVVVGIISVFLVIGLFSVIGSATGIQWLGSPGLIAMVILALTYWTVFSLLGAIYQVRIRNHILKNLELDNTAQFRSTMKLGPYLSLIATNMLMLIATVGLAYPVTRIRKAAYLASVTQVALSPAASVQLDKATATPGSFGEEAAGFFDFDLSLA